MENELYKREIIINEKAEIDKNLELIMSILKVRKDIEIANRNFEYAEGELIDYYIYQIKANNSKMDYLLKKAKKRGIVLDMKRRMEIKYNKAI